MKGITYWGVTLVARQELRTRLRTGRWRWLLGIWFVVIGALSVFFWISLGALGESRPLVPMFGGLMLFVLLLTLLVAPVLTAQSINGERDRGTLAALQLTALAPGDIALGKLLAAWSVGLALLGLTLPFAAWPVAGGDITLGRAIAVVLVVALLIGVVCALSMAWSAVVVRTMTSALLSYMTVFALMAGTALLYFMTLPLTSERTTLTNSYGEETGTYQTEHSERIWWLLAPNPFVVLADAAPRLPAEKRWVCCTDTVATSDERSVFDPLGDLSRSVRKIRRGPATYVMNTDGPVVTRGKGGPVWPYGLGFNLLLAGGAVWVTARRLRTPLAELPKGVRIA